MNVVLSKILGASNALAELCNQDFGGKVNYAVGKISNYIESEAKVIQGAIKKIQLKFVVKDAKGTPSIPTDKQEDFEKEIEDLLSTTTDYKGWVLNSPQVKALLEANVKPYIWKAIDFLMEHPTQEELQPIAQPISITEPTQEVKA